MNFIEMRTLLKTVLRSLKSAHVWLLLAAGLLAVAFAFGAGPPFVGGAAAAALA